MKTKTWNCGNITKATPSERNVWIAYTVMGQPGVVMVGQADVYYGVRGWQNIYLVDGVVANTVFGEYKTEEEAETRADEIAAEGYCSVAFTRA